MKKSALVLLVAAIIIALSSCKKGNEIQPIKPQVVACHPDSVTHIQDTVQIIKTSDTVWISDVATNRMPLGVATQVDSPPSNLNAMLLQIEFTVHSSLNVNLSAYQPIEILYGDRNYKIVFHNAEILSSYVNGNYRESRLLTKVIVTREIGLPKYDIRLWMAVLEYSAPTNGVNLQHKSISIDLKTDSILF
jgi:hypothetical protein